MQIKIPSPRHYETMHGSSELVRKYLDQIEVKLEDIVQQRRKPEQEIELHPIC